MSDINVENDLKNFLKIGGEYPSYELSKYFTFEMLYGGGDWEIYKFNTKGTDKFFYLKVGYGECQEFKILGFLSLEQGLKIENKLIESRRKAEIDMLNHDKLINYFKPCHRIMKNQFRQNVNEPIIEHARD